MRRISLLEWQRQEMWGKRKKHQKCLFVSYEVKSKMNSKRREWSRNKKYGDAHFEKLKKNTSESF